MPLKKQFTSKPRQPDRMTPDERLTEVARILATGLMRVMRREGARNGGPSPPQNPAKNPEDSLDKPTP